MEIITIIERLIAGLPPQAQVALVVVAILLILAVLVVGAVR